MEKMNSMNFEKIKEKLDWRKLINQYSIEFNNRDGYDAN